MSLHPLCSYGIAAQLNYLSKTDLYGSVFLCKNPIFMSVWVMVIPLGITTTWIDPDGHKDRIFMKKYGAVQVCFGKVVFLCCMLYKPKD